MQNSRRNKNVVRLAVARVFAQQCANGAAAHGDRAQLLRRARTLVNLRVRDHKCYSRAPSGPARRLGYLDQHKRVANLWNS